MTPSKEERDANLDAFKEALDAYFSRELERIDRETRFLEEILRIRGASGVAVVSLNNMRADLERDLRAALEVRDGS